ncbi:MAG: hypothetical protein LPK13_08575 [Marinobacter sp.]|uniref:hypothetical protein n=1 Tax=Marinobacter sp. TaxID=50741 RepID=UPI0029C5EB77|nr:hypothetical protein [Marinobacter sp.]MDX5336127.1 hypothetical protein [Marinobacter sp.]MDX5387167.1 hypothetical protein [Marinobacter sp.]MDX5441184.1 hypothetical protein [Alteromonadaceae bacterium]MDX5472542.1 hypothetical protein [Marinobacter sp.]
MSDRKQFITVMVVAALFVSWIGWRGFEVISLNNRLMADKTVASYPYQHRVLRVEGDTAVISSLRSHSVSTQQALSAVFPSMRHLADTHRDWQRAERELAQVQARAGDIILATSGVNRVRWELDENWYHLQSMKSRYNTAF